MTRDDPVVDNVAGDRASGGALVARPAAEPEVIPPAPSDAARALRAGDEPVSAQTRIITIPAAAPRRGRKLLIAVASLVAVAAGGYYAWHYWTVGRFQVSTDDAYVKADNTTIAPKVSGYIAAVLVGDNQQVKTGQILAQIDDGDFRVTLDQTKADVAAALAAIATKNAQLSLQEANIAAARNAVDVDQANLTFAEQEDQRYGRLAKTGYGSVQNAQQAASRAAAARATLARDKSALDAATGQVEVLKAELAQAQATLAHDRAVQRQAELNLSYTTIMSPIDGVVGNRAVRIGQYVQAGTQLMAVVPLEAPYIIANYKETQLTDVRPGQPATISVDTFPGVIAKGHVDSIAPASGQEFALLPPDNATGNFTKVVQRIPVKIVLDPGSPLVGALRPGMSVYPTITTTPGATAAPKPPARASADRAAQH
jgi:membrane fusion protein (multidrug efflux system)